MKSSLLGCDLREEHLLPCYFFYGEETYPAEEFVEQLKGLIGGSSEEEFELERFYLDEARWSDVLDTARTVPFLFHPWRLLVVWLPERGSSRKGGRSESPGRGTRYLSAGDQKILGEYLQEPAARTVLVLIQPGRIRRSDAIVRFFSSFPKSAVLVKELKPYTAYQTRKWAERKASSLGKSLTERARDRLYEIIGSDLRLLSNELEKLAVYIGDKKVIDADDIDEVTAWARSFETYELDDTLYRRNFEQSLVVLDRLFTEGVEPEQIVGRLTGFFQNLLSASLWLSENRRDRKSIFAEFFPNIKETYQDLYRRKFDGFFGVVDSLSSEDLNVLLSGLRALDRSVKTSDVKAETALQAFMKEYCLLGGRKKTTRKG